jgi:hypothetical protein
MSTPLLRVFDCYAQVIQDKNIVKWEDLEMCDLRYYTRRYKASPVPVIQVYKMNAGGKEIMRTFNDVDEGIRFFLKVKSGRS